VYEAESRFNFSAKISVSFRERLKLVELFLNNCLSLNLLENVVASRTLAKQSPFIRDCFVAESTLLATTSSKR